MDRAQECFKKLFRYSKKYNICKLQSTVAICLMVLFFIVGCDNNTRTNLKCTSCGAEIAGSSRFCSNCGNSIEDSTDNDLDNDENVSCSHNWKDATCINPKTCSKCGETSGNALGHTTTAGICDRCNERQGWSKSEVQSLLKIYAIFVSDINSADGVDMKIAWENTSSKTIKYIYFTVEAYNAVDDKVSCDVRDYYYFTGKSTGPFESGYTNLIYDSEDDEYWVNTVFENCYYNSTIRYFEITEIEIIYMDDTTVKFDDSTIIEYANADIPQGLFYTWNDDLCGYEVNYRLKNECTDKQITIPSTHNGKNVVAISDNAFQSITSLECVDLPNTLKYIGEWAFDGCMNLSKIAIPDQVLDIGFYAFNECSKIREITIPVGVTEISDSLFSYCTNLVKVNMPSGITSIGQGAFFGCENLITVNIPNSVASIGAMAFCQCTNLESIVIPINVKEMGWNVFSSSPNLTIYCEVSSEPSGWDYDWYYEVGQVIWGYTISNTDITYTLSEDGSYYIIASTEFFSDESFAIPSEYNGKPVKEIAEEAFAYNLSLKSISIPNSIEKIGDGAFYYCQNLESINIPENLTDIGAWAFRDCSKLEEISISSNVASIGNSAFSGCTSLTNIAVDSNNAIYKSILGNLYSKDGKTLIQYAIGKEDTSFRIPETVTSIDDYAFLLCENLASVIMSDRITNIGWDVFNGCVNLTIYCMTNNRQAGWDTDWNYCYGHINGTDYCSVVWNYTD